MRTRLLDEAAFLATMTGTMRDITDSATGPDLVPYVEAIPAEDTDGLDIGEQFIEYVFRTADDRFDHVLIATTTKDVYIAIVVDRVAEAVHGHHILDLPKLYGTA